MYTDANLRVSAAQVVTVSAVSTNIIDLGSARDIGEGNDMQMNIATVAAVTAAGAATVEFQVIGSPNNDLSAATILGSSGAIGKAALPINQPVCVKFNPQIASKGFRYVGVNYNVGTGPLLTGAFTADLVETIQDGKKFYPSSF